MNAVARVIPCRASFLPLYGSMANQVFRFHLLQDAADHVRHMLTSGPMPLEWPMAPPAGSDRSSFSSSHEDLLDEHPGDSLPALPHLLWRHDALQPPQAQQGGAGRNTCVLFPGADFDVLPGTLEVLLGRFLPHISRDPKHN